MMDCTRYLEMMQRELDDELSELEMKMLAKHVSQCPSCAAEYRSFQLLANLFTDVEMKEPPQELKSAVMETILWMEPDRQNAAIIASEQSTKIDWVMEGKKRIGFLIAIAILNAFFFGFWMISLTGFGFTRYHLMAFVQVMTQSFERFMVIGQYTGNAVQVVFKSLVHFVPWDWVCMSLMMTGVLVLSLWTWIRRKGGGLT